MKHLSERLLFNIEGKISTNRRDDLKQLILKAFDMNYIALICGIHKLTVKNKEKFILLTKIAIAEFEKNNILLFKHKCIEKVYQHHHYLKYSPTVHILNVKYNKQILTSDEYKSINQSPKHYICLAGKDEKYIPTIQDDKTELSIEYIAGIGVNNIPECIANQIRYSVKEMYENNELEEIEEKYHANTE